MEEAMSKVLVVEDEADIRELLADTLADAGYQVVQATDGGEGLTCALTKNPDVVLLDVMMPVLDGFQVLEQLKGNAGTSKLPVIMVSARGQEAEVQKALQAGAFAYIIKPWLANEVEAKVREALHSSPAQAGL
ncbi:MAG: response regulator [SAR202 cluster bacterium]|nr:response regulator [SAR202 cluster bacterium]